ncbi:hypothetical protein GCM10022403_092530 [Streptomyces coacervatus]|uniref:Uncharacterized protein n=1 Tax=Streptomyces coacervatus TaxID=647381 RepID=A0ABP7JKM5_9ACTN|nr:hypothetical protein [Streptomyces coacervatus]MDF2273295.1 hypothetical protein [Streptomyces coacervatus]
MEHVSLGDWTLPWVLKARQVSHGAIVAGLLVDLAVDGRQTASVRTVQFPLRPAARALGVQPVLVRTALHRLADAGMVNFHIDDHPVDGPQATVEVLPVISAAPSRRAPAHDS